MGRWEGPRRPRKRGRDEWLPGAPEDAAEPSPSVSRRARRVRTNDVPHGLTVTPGALDGWVVQLHVRRRRAMWPRVLAAVVLALLVLVGIVVAPSMAALPASLLVGLALMVLTETTTPGGERDASLSVGSRGLQCGDVSVPCSEIRDVFWRDTLPGEMMFGVRGPAGEVDVARVPLAPAFGHGLTDEHRLWIEAIVREVGRASQQRSGSARDVPRALAGRLADRES